jgi:hypothetical protein
VALEQYLVWVFYGTKPPTVLRESSSSVFETVFVNFTTIDSPK